ncbi:MAG: choice-of-anchor J domain-containing protein [Flavobacteriaceae bacterium]|nr:choice-of-anchor J domain-containing protein [Flavobacteriaceae bacterium]
MKKLTLLVCIIGYALNLNAQNSCSNAGIITAGTTSVGTINGSAPTLICDSQTAGAKGEWYAYTASTDGFANITTDLAANSGNDTNLHVYYGSCGSLNCLASSDDITPSNLLSEANFPISNGVTYFIAFDNRWDASGFDFLITETAVSCTNSSLPVAEDFSNTNTIIACWDLIDSDLDNRKWFTQDYDLDGIPGLDGNPCIVSRSWSATGLVNPDNWLISYSIDLTSNSPSDLIDLNWKARGLNSSFADENYTVYAATGNQISDFLSSAVSFNEIIGQNGGAGETFVDRSLDISSLAGNMVYIAFRHHNMPVSQYELNIDDVQVNLSTLGIDDFVTDSFKHYYNNNTNVLTLKSSNAPINNIEIYNILGQRILIKKLSHTNELINLSTITEGVYIAQISIDNTTKTIKFLKQ